MFPSLSRPAGRFPRHPHAWRHHGDADGSCNTSRPAVRYHMQPGLFLPVLATILPSGSTSAGPHRPRGRGRSAAHSPGLDLGGGRIVPPCCQAWTSSGQSHTQPGWYVRGCRPLPVRSSLFQLLAGSVRPVPWLACASAVACCAPGCRPVAGTHGCFPGFSSLARLHPALLLWQCRICRWHHRSPFFSSFACFFGIVSRRFRFLGRSGSRSRRIDGPVFFNTSICAAVKSLPCERVAPFLLSVRQAAPG